VNLSVVIPTYNGARFLRDACESVYAQTRQPDEVIVVDDCSTDGTAELAESLAADAPVPVRVMRLAANSGGPALPINVGVQAARGEYVGVLDQDDAYRPDALRQATAALDALPQCSFAFYWAGDMARPDGGPLPAESFRQGLCDAAIRRGEHLELPAEHLLQQLALKGNFTGGYPGFVFRRSCWDAMGGADEAYRIASDMQVLGGLLQRGSAVVVPMVGYLKRVHGANATNDRPRMCYEIARVQAGLLQTAECLRNDHSAAEQIKRAVGGYAYMLRQAQRYGEAADLYRLLAGLGESRRATVAAMAKLHLHRALALVLRRVPEYSPYTQPRAAADARGGV
jgi:hypothetical protein